MNALSFTVIDGQTSRPLGSYTSYTAAKRRADALDLKYGAHRYYVRAS